MQKGLREQAFLFSREEVTATDVYFSQIIAT
jgi:hypothetical protein